MYINLLYLLLAVVALVLVVVVELLKCLIPLFLRLFELCFGSLLLIFIRIVGRLGYNIASGVRALGIFQYIRLFPYSFQYRYLPCIIEIGIIRIYISSTCNRCCKVPSWITPVAGVSPSNSFCLFPCQLPLCISQNLGNGHSFDVPEFRWSS